MKFYIVLLNDFNSKLPEAFINSLPKEYLTDTNSGIDFNRYCKEFRHDPVVVAQAKKYPEFFTISSLDTSVVSYDIVSTEYSTKEYVKSVVKSRGKLLSVTTTYGS